MDNFKRGMVANQTPQQDTILCNKTLVVISLLLLFQSVCFGIVISSKVVDPDRRPIEDAVISDGHKRVFSKTDGSFSLNATGDSLYISRLGYKQASFFIKEVPQYIVLQEQTISLPSVRIIGTYTPVSASALGTGTVFPGTDSKPSSVADVLLQNSSFSSPDVALTGEKQTLSLLGNLSRHTLVILDGVVQNPAGEAYDFSTLPLERIERIEIVKGNASLYGGGNAIGGVVNLYSKQASVPKGLKAETAMTTGSFGLWKDRYQAQYRKNGKYFNLEYTGYSADNDFQYKPRPWWNMSGNLTRTHNRKTSQNVDMKIGFDGDNLSMGYTVASENYMKQLPGPVNFLPLYDNAVLDGVNLNQNVRLQYLKNQTGETVTAWLNSEHSVYNNDHSSNPIYVTSNSHSQQTLGIKSQTSLVHGQYKLDYLAEISGQQYEFIDWDDTDSIVPLQTRNMEASSIRGEDKFDFSWGEYVLAGGARYDGVEGFDGFLSWRVEQQVKLQSMADLSLGYDIGSAFALPSFYDLYWKGDTQSMGNPDLKPETSWGQSLWSNLEYSSLSLKASVHQNRIKDLIQWRQVYLFGTVWKPVNISEAEIWSQEYELAYCPIAEVSFSGSATGVLARDKSLNSDGTHSPAYNKKLIYTPDWRFTGRLAYKKTYAGADISLNYTGKQYSTADNLIAPLPAVTLVNASAFAKAGYKRFALQGNLKLNNVFDKQYEVYVYVPQPGFNWNCSLELSYEM